MNARPDILRRPASVGGAWAIGWWWCLVLLVGCDRAGEAPPPTPAVDSRTVVTAFHPLAFFAEQIAGNRVSVRCWCPPEADPSLWSPSRAELQQIQNASLILLNGANFEPWAATASLPVGRVIVTSRAFEAEWMSLPTVVHSHGAGGAHTHSGLDGHTWMDPVLARRQAAEILAAFKQRWPGDAATFQAGFERLATEFAALESAFRDLTPDVQKVVIFTSHPAYGYLARRFGWTTISLPLPPDEQPSPAQWAEVAKAVAAAPSGPRLMFFESEPLPMIRQRLLTDWQVATVVFQTCETPSRDGSYFERMKQNVETLRRAVGQAPR